MHRHVTPAGVWSAFVYSLPVTAVIVVFLLEWYRPLVGYGSVVVLGTFVVATLCSAGAIVSAIVGQQRLALFAFAWLVSLTYVWKCLCPYYGLPWYNPPLRYRATVVLVVFAVATLCSLGTIVSEFIGRQRLALFAFAWLVSLIYAMHFLTPYYYPQRAH